MRTPSVFLLLALALPLWGSSQAVQSRDAAPVRGKPLAFIVAEFNLTDAILRDAVSKLSLENIEGLHLGFEETIRHKIQEDPRVSETHFSLNLKNKTVAEILDALCRSDPRYNWSEDGASVNIYPRTVTDDPSYLLTQQITRIELTEVPDPDQALTPLSRIFPQQQIGYFGGGGKDGYARPWTTVLQQLSVRQFINRIAEHMGGGSVWVWQGGTGERMFTFFRGGFSTSRPRGEPPQTQ